MTEIRSVRDGIVDYRKWATDPNPRIGLGIPAIDRLTGGGLAKAEAALCLAYSSVGKTTLALNAILANPHVPTMFFSLEMSWRMVVARLAAMKTGLTTSDMEDMLRDGIAVPGLDQVAREYPLLFGDDRSALSVKEMSATLTAAERQIGCPIRFGIIDYLELVGGAGLLGKAEAVDRAATKVRDLAKDHDLSVLVLHQVGKGDGSDGWEPLSLDSGRYGGHQPMDQVYGMYAPRLNRKLSEGELEAVKNDLYVQVLKNRSRGKVTPPVGVKHHLDDSGVIRPVLSLWEQARQPVMAFANGEESEYG